MDDTGSFLLTAVTRVRAFLDDPEAEAKYANDWIVRHILMPSMVQVVGELNLDAQNPIVAAIDVAVTTDESVYELPPCLGEVLRVCRRDTSHRIIEDFVPKHPWHVYGEGWRIQGRTIVFQPKPFTDQTWSVEFVTNADVQCHLGSGTLDAEKTTVTLAATPTVGLLDRRTEAYRGQILRLLPASGVIEERIIVSHDASAGTVTVDRAFSATAGAVEYEIAPQWGQALCSAIVARGALMLGAMRDMTHKKAEFLSKELRAAKKTVADNLSNVQARTGRRWLTDTVDNEG